ncbi:MAG: transposase, partial [Verrucomicrobia bacterium]|nr:transposase [Verrucomicrobiota bacterium]
ESFNGKFREECLDQNAFSKLKEAQKIAEEWGAYYNNERPHSALGYKSPKEFAQEEEENFAISTKK